MKGYKIQKSTQLNTVPYSSLTTELHTNNHAPKQAMNYLIGQTTFRIGHLSSGKTLHNTLHQCHHHQYKVCHLQGKRYQGTANNQKPLIFSYDSQQWFSFSMLFRFVLSKNELCNFSRWLVQNKTTQKRNKIKTNNVYRVTLQSLFFRINMRAGRLDDRVSL